MTERSTSTNLVDLTLATSNTQAATVAYIDYKKTFDSVRHSNSS